jgi:predicted component of viral defense system (DUF524 family)
MAAEKRMHQLYEYWCFFRLVDAMREVATQLTQTSSLLQVVDDGWKVKLKAGRASRLKFECETASGDLRSVDLFYNRGFSPRGKNRGSYSLPFRPDYTICIEGVEGTNPSYCHFDAKYRSQDELTHFEFDIEVAKPTAQEGDFELNANEAQAIEEEKDAERSRVFKDGDIYKMHTYKDAIFESHGAYVLYPGNRVGLYRDSVDPKQAADLPSVGAFPLRPGGADGGKSALVSFLRRIFN